MGSQVSGTPGLPRLSLGMGLGLGLVGLLALTGCGLFTREQSQSSAKPGDLLVQVGGQRVVLVAPVAAL